MLNNMKRIREARRMSQYTLAEKIGSTQQSISKYENGKAEPDIETLKRIADQLEVSIDELVGRESYRKAFDYGPDAESGSRIEESSEFFERYIRLPLKERRMVDMLLGDE